MANIKDLFKSYANNQSLVSKSLNDTDPGVESADYSNASLEVQNKVEPYVDFAKPENFAFYGSAKQYYKDAFSYIENEFPYDGSGKEKFNWELNASAFDLYIYDKEYPRTTGYIKLGVNYGGFGAGGISGYEEPLIDEYISFKGGPHPSDTPNTTLARAFDSNQGAIPDANYYNALLNQQSNLELNAPIGNTVEFWFKKNGWSVASESTKQIFVDVWNNASLGSSYGRLRIECDFAITPHQFSIAFQSGTTAGFLDSDLGKLGQSINLTSSTWDHYAFAFINNSASLEAKLYLNGQLNDTTTTGSIGEISGSMLGWIGAMGTSINSPATGALGYAKLSGSMDEFRFWKTKRSSEDIGLNWFSQINGGTNTDFSRTYNASTKYDYTNPVDLGVYYKFNEGITNVTSSDQKILDYSGRITNGLWTGYSSGSRSTNSAMIESSASAFEFRDPILYSYHPDVSSKLSTLVNKGQTHDLSNNAMVYDSLPSWIIDEDTESGETLLKLTQIMSSYFDKLQIQAKSLPSIKDNDYISSSYKPYPFADRLLDSTGFTSVELFEVARAIEKLSDRDDYRLFTEKINDTKNRIYQNIYNNLVSIYKSKGTEKSIRSLIRCYGVGEELIKTNLYGDQITFELKENYESTSTQKNYANFHNTGSFEATVYQSSSLSDSGSRSYLSGTSFAQVNGATFETEVLFPIRLSDSPKLSFYVPFSDSSLFGVHTVDPSNPESLSWHTPDIANFQVSVHRSSLHDKDAYFKLTGSSGGCVPLLTSSLMKDVYNNSKWNFAVRVKPTTYPWSPSITGSTPSTYDLEFLGYNTVLDTIDNSFIVTGTLSHEDGSSFLSSSKRSFIGAHRTNFTGSTLQKSDARISSVRYWYDYLDNKTILAHAQDPSNYGRKHPGQNSFLNQSGSVFASQVVKVPQAETLALNWAFDQVTGSDASGEFIVKDFSSGSLADAGTYGWLGAIAKTRHPGKGFGFPSENVDVAKREFVYTAKQQPPEVLNSSDMVSIKTEGDIEVYTTESRPIDYFFTVEKSMNAIISSEMLKLFATVLDFNNLIGEPVNRYRQEYKSIEKMRELFFRKVQNSTIDFEKFVDYYKWLDNSIVLMLTQIFPASANFSNKIFNIIESHVLERSKYWNKFPTLEMEAPDLDAGLYGINEMLYPYRRGGAPIPNTLTGSDCVWWHERTDRSNTDITSGDATIDTQRNTIREANDWRPAAKPPTLTDISTGTPTQYEGGTFALRNFTKPYRFIANELPTIHGGSNFPKAKKIEYTHDALNFDSPAELTVAASSIAYEKDCNDVIIPNEKNRLEYKLENSTDVDGYTSGKGTLLAPFSLFSSSVSTGYVSDIASNFREKTEIDNYHNDSYGDDKGIPLQGPFTEKHVGGAQHRHIDLNTSSATTTLDRPEAWNLSLALSTLTISPRSADEPRAIYIRDEYAKRPVNIRNIKWGTDTPTIGNYRKDYQILQTSGRSLNNRFFVKNGGFVPQFATSSYGNWSDFALPRFDLIGKNQSIFVERFSAPGGPEVNSLGSLDLYAEEFSIYNNINLRNAIVREPLNSWYTDFCGQFGIRSGSSVNPLNYNTLASYHKVNRNPVTVGSFTGPLSTNVTTSINRDNWFIQHQIPQSELQYSWINDSYNNLVSQPFGLLGSGDGGRTNFTVPSGSSSSIASPLVQFISSSTFEFPFLTDGENYPISFTNLLPYSSSYSPNRYKYTVDKHDIEWASLTDAYLAENENLIYELSPEKVAGQGWSNTKLINNSSVEFEFDRDWTAGPEGGFVYAGVAVTNDPSNEKSLAILSPDYGMVFINTPGSADALLYPIVYEYDPDLAPDEPRFAFPNPSLRGTGNIKKWEIGEKFRIRRNDDKIFYERNFKTRNWHLYYASTRPANSVSQLSSSDAEYGRGFRDTRDLYINFFLWGGAIRNIKIVNEENLLIPGNGYLSGSTDIPKELNIHLNNLNGPYGYPSWKQVRTGENPITRWQKNNNVITVGPSRLDLKSITQNTSITRQSPSVSSFTEPPVTFKYNPLRTTLKYTDTIFNPGGPGEEFKVSHAFCNNLYYFANQSVVLSDGFNLPAYTYPQPQITTEKRPLQMYDAIYDQYVDTNNNGRFVDIEYTEFIFPKEINTGLNKTRSRVNYKEDAPLSGSFAIADYGDDGIDRDSRKRRTFWSNTW